MRANSCINASEFVAAILSHHAHGTRLFRNMRNQTVPAGTGGREQFLKLSPDEINSRPQTTAAPFLTVVKGVCRRSSNGTRAVRLLLHPKLGKQTAPLSSAEPLLEDISGIINLSGIDWLSFMPARTDKAWREYSDGYQTK
jgi:hypothetical protein